VHAYSSCTGQPEAQKSNRQSNCQGLLRTHKLATRKLKTHDARGLCLRIGAPAKVSLPKVSSRYIRTGMDDSKLSLREL
jgi:hypothetical protein